MLERNKIIELYKLYGFEVEEDNPHCLVFSYSTGYFFNAEVLSMEQGSETEIELVKKRYEDIGYSVSLISYKDVDFEKIHRKLFNGFFNVSSSHKRNAECYAKYCEQQSERLLNSQYKYLQCDYVTSDEIKSDNVVDLIYNKLIADETQLVILEAAAGYGKTCTSFEVLNRFVDNNDLIPIMTELSRNRKAQIFKYVLLDEIDRSFSTKLSVNLVKKEITNGLVPLIIDGFDELLSKSFEGNPEENTSFEEAQNMLDTIANLLKNGSKAKILLTSRKSAIFAGEQFDEWVEAHDLGEKITRIELNSPNIRKWLSPGVLKILNEKKVNIDFLGNPIMLSMLKEQSEDTLKETGINGIINDYFGRILTREINRQNLRLKVEEQFLILSKLAAKFSEFNITSEEAEFLLLLFEDIIGDKVKTYIARYKDAYSTVDEDMIPNEEEFLMKLVHGALLDRKFSKRNEIGFVNDFVFGFLLGNALINGCVKEEIIDYKYLDLICMAFQSDEMNNKGEIERIVQESIDCYSVNQQMNISNKLFHRTIKDYRNETITNITFSRGFTFSEGFSINNCTFQDCSFHSCFFGSNTFENTRFYNCVFFSPNLNGVPTENKNLSFLGCVGHEAIAERFSFRSRETVEPEIDFEKIVLEQFWKKGSPNAERYRGFTTLRKGLSTRDIPHMDLAITNLIRKGIIEKRSVCYELNMDKISEIKRILDRGDDQ